MSLENISKEKMPTPEEFQQMLNQEKMAKDKLRLIEDRMRAMESSMNTENRSDKRSEMERDFNTINTQRKLIIGNPVDQIDARLREIEQQLNDPSKRKDEKETLETQFNSLEAEKKNLQNQDVKSPEIQLENVPVSNGGEANPNIELGPGEGAEVIPAPEVPQSATVFVSSSANATAESAPDVATSVPTSAQTTIEQPNSGNQNTSPEDPNIIQARNIAQKIKNNNPLSNEELAFKKNPETYALLETEMMKNVEQAKPIEGTTAEQSLEKNLTPAEKLQRSRENYVAAFFEDRKNPQANKDDLLALKAEYDKNIDAGLDAIRKENKSLEFLLGSIRDEKRTFEKEILSRDSAENRERVAKAISKGSNAAGTAFLYSILLSGKLIGDGIDLAKKGINKITNGGGKSFELLKKWGAESYKKMKANSGDPNANIHDAIMSPLHALFGGKTGTRSFEQGSKEQQAEAKKKLEEEKKKNATDKKTADLENKKTENGDNKKTPEELEKSQMKKFLKTSFESGHEGNQMTELEGKQASEAWKKLKDKSADMFMRPEDAVFKDKQGKEIKKTVSDYSKAEQGLHKKIKDAYDDAVYQKTINDKTTLEEFIKMSIKNGTLK